MDFTCRENAFGGFEVYNNKIGDIYFSNVGAHKEAVEKFVIPAIPVLKGRSKIKILDVCYGMGYNSKSFYDYILKNNFGIECEIDGIENDKNILALGLFVFDKNISDEIHGFFGKSLLDSLNLEENIKNISGENWIKNVFYENSDVFFRFLINKGIYLYKKDEIPAFLHNIYYQNHVFLKNPMSFRLIFGDLLEILPELDVGYDLIFHDAFSILKQPELWSENVLKYYYNILNSGGRLLTYSNSRVLRRRLNEIGFKVEINYLEDEKQNGTIAIKT